MLSALDGLFLVGAVGFWILVGIACVALLVSVETDSPGWATITCGICFVLLAAFGDFNFVVAMRENPLLALGAFAGYITSGVAWSIGKWWFFLKERRAAYDEQRREFLQSHDVTGTAIPCNLQRDWCEQARMTLDVGHNGGVIPSPKRHKRRIMTWMMYWPWSMLWTLINDPIRRLFRAIYLRIQGVYERIAETIWGDVRKDFFAEHPEKPQSRDR